MNGKQFDTVYKPVYLHYFYANYMVIRSDPYFSSEPGNCFLLCCRIGDDKLHVLRRPVYQVVIIFTVGLTFGKLQAYLKS